MAQTKNVKERPVREAPPLPVYGTLAMTEQDEPFMGGGSIVGGSCEKVFFLMPTSWFSLADRTTSSPVPPPAERSTQEGQ